jgi:hypothetical protein
MPTTVVRRLRLRFVKTNRACVDSRMGAIAGIRGQATPLETMSRRYRRHTTPVSGGKGQALLASRACKDSVALTALEIQGQATDDLRGIPRPRVGREKIHVVEDDTISILQHADMLSNIEQTLTLGCKASGGVTGCPRRLQAANGSSPSSRVSIGSTNSRYGYKRWVSFSMRYRMKSSQSPLR